MARPRVVLDVMGSDRGPEAVIDGGVLAAKQLEIDVILAGDQELIRENLSRRSKKYIENILHAPEIVQMEDGPTRAIRRKKNSSLVKGVEYVRQGRADAFVSPANTGAVLAASLLTLGRIKGISRPGIAAILPTVHGKNVVLVDAGANVDCEPEHLCEFALMGSTYAKEVLGVENPKIGLLNIGAERIKGNELSLKTFFLLEELGNFYGNVEGNNILEGDVDVVVCDGFAGNVLLKAYEGGAGATVDFFKKTVANDIIAKLGALILYPALKKFKRSISAAQYGGAPLLGTREVVIVAHGNSDAEAIKNAIRVAHESVHQKLIEKIEQGIQTMLPKRNLPNKEVSR